MTESLQKWIDSWAEPDLLSATRVHALPDFGGEEQTVFVKREDESGFGISGSKKRKYASLLPYLERSGVQLVGIVGGDRSNHVIGLLQLLRERQIPTQLFLKAGSETRLSGNRLLLDLLTEESDITWVADTSGAALFQAVSQQLQKQSDQYFLVPEGGSCQEALPGACSLILDIQRNEEALGATFDHICMDAGTGLSAAALLLTNHYLQRPTQIHIVQMAGQAGEMEQMIRQAHQWAHELGLPIPMPPSPNIQLPSTAKSFGRVNASVKGMVRHLARQYGILAEPLYVAKLFLSFQQLAYFQQLKGRILLIHSGGGTGMMGWEY
ncbi:MAG: pyridoxal-phosphate dependent enzyme [Bacteroidota bacterium]